MESNIGGAAHRAALTSLDQARRSVARLSMRQNAEDRAADLIESWGAVETALRSLLGGSTLTGRALIHELRGRQVITLEQANSLAEFSAAKDRAERVGYEPTESDVSAAREAFLNLEMALLEGSSPSPAAAPAAAAAAAAPVTGGLTDPILEPTARGGAPEAAPLMPTPARRRPLAWIIAAIAVVAVLAGAWWVLRGRSEAGSMQAGVEYYRNGQRERASAAFERAAREDPRDPMPRVYLSRMAREVGNYSLARDEAQKAIEANPQSAAALGEMARVLMALQNWDLARSFWVRAAQADPNDRAAQGWLACTLHRLGRPQEAQRFRERAGPGDWDACVRSVPPAGALPPGAMPPQGQGVYPGGVPPQGAYPPPPPQPGAPRQF